MLRSLLVLLVVFNCTECFQSSSHRTIWGSNTQRLHASLFSLFTEEKKTTNTEKRDEIIQNLLAEARVIGQVGSKTTPENRQKLVDIAKSLSTYTDKNPAKIPLASEEPHNLIYSASPGGSSGAVGPFVGKVEQNFPNEKDFINSVQLFGGVLKVQLFAERKVLDSKRIRVTFKETVVNLFGNEVLRKDTKGQGVWNHLFVGEVEIEGKRRLLRVLETPSLFIIENDL